MGVEIHTDTDGIELLETVRTVVKSPGVPATSPVIVAAQERGIEVTGELEIAWRATPNPVIAVTGTNGKTTTTELIAHILRRAGREVAVAGNIGTALADLVTETTDTNRPIVCECSSFQLEDTSRFAPECAVFLNLSPDHLDRHGSLESYRVAKMAVFSRQTDGDIAVVNADDPASPNVTPGRRVEFCAADCDISRLGTTITWQGRPLIEATELQLIGAHNEENAMAAAAATLAIGVDPDDVAAGLAGFTGVPHRLEPVADLNGVLFVNDSKATNVVAAAIALASFGGRVHAILGGSLKGESFEGLADPVAANCAGCYLIGPAAERIAADLSRALPASLARAGRDLDDPVPLHRCANLADAVRQAAAGAGAGQVVLLSPACASFDEFRDFEHRGESFRRIVEELR